MRRRDFLGAAGAAMAVAPLLARTGPADSQPARALLENFPTHKQETPYTCGPASARLVLEYLGHEVPESEIAERMGTSPTFGTAHGPYIKAFRQYLEELGTGLRPVKITGKHATTEFVTASILDNLPLVASYLTENHFKPQTAVGHYVVVIGFDMSKNEFTLSNPFGYHEQIDIDRFWRLAEWWPKRGDIPNVKYWKTPRLHVPRTLIALEKA